MAESEGVLGVDVEALIFPKREDILLGRRVLLLLLAERLSGTALPLGFGALLLLLPLTPVGLLGWTPVGTGEVLEGVGGMLASLSILSNLSFTVFRVELMEFKRCLHLMRVCTGPKSAGEGVADTVKKPSNSFS